MGLKVNRSQVTSQQREQSQIFWLLPGVGWDMVPTDSLAQQFSRVVHPVLPRIALQVATAMPRGAAIRAGEIVGAWLMARVDGALVYTPHAMSALSNFGDGNATCAPLTTMPEPNNYGPFDDVQYVRHLTDAVSPGQR